MEGDTICIFCNKEIKKNIYYCPYCGKKQPKIDSTTYSLNPYEILQVSRDAESEVIDAAYKSLARKYHPDTNNTDYATKKMQEINWAYGILHDVNSRRKWDFENDKPQKQTQTKSKKTTASDEKNTPNKVEKSENNAQKEETIFPREEYITESVQRDKSNSINIKAIFALICLFVLLFSCLFNGNRNINNTQESQAEKVISQRENVFPTPTEKPVEIQISTPTYKPQHGDIIFKEDFNNDIPIQYFEENTIYNFASNGKFVIGIQPKYSDNYWWSYSYSSWELNDYIEDIEYNFDIELLNREKYRLSEDDLGKTAVPIEYGFYIGNIEKLTFVSISLVEWDGKLVNWNIADNNSLLVRKSNGSLSNSYDICEANFNSFYNESGLQASRGSLVYQNSLKSGCGFKFTNNENKMFGKKINSPLSVKIIIHGLDATFYLNEEKLQDFRIPEKYYLYNPDTDKLVEKSLEKDDLKNFGFVLFNYGKAYEIGIDNFKAIIP